MDIGTYFGLVYDTGEEASRVATPYTPNTIQVTEDAPGLVKLVNTAVPINFPSVIKIATTKLSNVYNTPFARGVVPIEKQLDNVNGHSVFVELQCIVRNAADPDDHGTPITCRVDLRFPDYEYLSSEDLKAVIRATLAAVANDDGTLRYTDIARGVLVPPWI